MTDSGRSSRGRDFLLLAGSIIVAFLLGEAAVRMFLPKPARANALAEVMGHVHLPDPQIGWVLSTAPVEYRHRLVDDKGVVQYDVTYHVADQQRWTSNQLVDAPLLITAGCSFTFGHGLDDQDTWPWLLQEKLSNYHVVNLGTMGYGTDQALLAARRQIEKHPGKTAAVVLGYGDFQIERVRSPQGWMVVLYPLSKPLYASSPRGPEYLQQVRFLSWGFWSAYSDLLGHLANKLGNSLNHVPSHNQARQVSLDLIAQFAQEMGAQGIKFAVVMLPYVDDNSSQSRADQKFMIDGMQAAGIPVLKPQFPRLANGGIDVSTFLVSKIDRHPNRAYNVLLTSQLKPFLEGAAGIR